MGNKESDNLKLAFDNMYVFKPFQFEKCIPCENKSGKIVAPKPRSGHRIICNNIDMYSYGGYNPAVGAQPGPDYYPLFKELWKYNFASKVWKELKCAGMPEVLASNAVALVGNNVIMVYGGTGVPFGDRCSNDLFVCNLSKTDNLSFSLVHTLGNVPPPKYGQAIVVKDNEHLYTVGGTTGFEFSLAIHSLDLKSKVWEMVYDHRGRFEDPPGRYRHELAFDGKDKIYILGGGTAETAFGFKDIEVYNLSVNQWERVSTFGDACSGYPSNRRCHSCVQYRETDGKLYVYLIGGYNRTSMCKDVWRLDLSTFHWTLISNYPMPVYFHSSAITPSGKVYTFGGIIKSGIAVEMTGRTNDVYSMWATIPKLKEICWEAVLYNNPKLGMLSRAQLFDYGIPTEYIDRLDFDS